LTLERELQEIQQKLGGERTPSSHPTGPHLALVSIEVVDAPSYSVITLWAPTTKRAEAEALLEAAGFKVS
jgi:hypothetical protein